MEKINIVEIKKNYPVASKLIVTLFVILLLGGVSVLADTIIRSGSQSTFDDGLDLGNGNLTANVINASEINNVLYVQAGNGSDIQVKIDMAKNGDKIIIPPSSSFYNLSLTLNITGIDDLIIENYGTIALASGWTKFQVQDRQDDTHSIMIYINDTYNLKFFNYGKIGDYGGSSSGSFYVNNSEHFYMHGGEITITPSIFNSGNVTLENEYRSGGTGIWGECIDGLNMNNIHVDSSGTSEGEIIELNAFVKKANINNVYGIGSLTATTDEALDINSAQDIILNNIIIRDTYKLFTLSNSSGPRHGMCDTISGKGLIGRNIQCINCQNSSAQSMENVDIEYIENGKRKFFTNYNITRGISGEELLRFWRLNNNTIDSSGNGQPLIGDIGITYDDGFFRNAIFLNGDASDPNITASGTGIFDEGKQSVSVWFKPTNVFKGTVQRVFVHPQTSGNNRLYISIETDGDLSYAIGDGSNFDLAGHIVNGQWYHVVVVRDRINNWSQGYLNGLLVVNRSATIGSDDISAIRIGSLSGTSEFFEGYIDEIMIFNNSLSEDEVLFLYRNRNEVIFSNEFLSSNGGNIRGNVNITGNLTISINSVLKLNKNTTELTCSSATNNGSIMYNGSSHWACNGFGWNALY